MAKLDELARRGDEARRRRDERLRDAGPPPESDEQKHEREQERSFIYRTHPLLQLARIVGWGSLGTLPVGLLLTIEFATASGPPFPLGAWLFALIMLGLGVVGLPWLFVLPRLVRRALADERGRYRAYPVEGWIETMADSWTFQGTMVEWHWGKLQFAVTMQASMGIEIVQRAVAAIDADATVECDRKTIRIESSLCDTGGEAYRFGRAVLDELLPALNAEHRIGYVEVSRDDNWR